MQGVSNPQGLLRVTWSDKWALLKEYNVFLNFVIDGRGTASPGTHTNWYNTLWKGQFGLHFPFLRYLHLESYWEARRELGWALRRFGKYQHLLTLKRFPHCTRNLLIVCVLLCCGSSIWLSWPHRIILYIFIFLHIVITFSKGRDNTLRPDLLILAFLPFFLQMLSSSDIFFYGKWLSV